MTSGKQRGEKKLSPLLSMSDQSHYLYLFILHMQHFPPKDLKIFPPQKKMKREGNCITVPGSQIISVIKSGENRRTGLKTPKTSSLAAVYHSFKVQQLFFTHVVEISIQGIVYYQILKALERQANVTYLQGMKIHPLQVTCSST